MRYELRSIPLWPVTKVAFFVNLIVGFVIGLLMAIFMMPMVAMLTSVAAYDAGELDLDSGSLSALTMVIPFLTALWSAFFNTILVIIIVLAYNLVTRIVGGIELHLDLIELSSFSAGLPPEPVSSGPEPPAPDSAEPAALPPITDRPKPPPPVITQPEPQLPDQVPPGLAEEGPDAEDHDDKNINE